MIKQIINELSDNNQSLVNPLNNELNGYHTADDNDVPLYRIAKASSHCNIQKGFITEYNTPIPISLLPEEFAKKMFLEFPLHDGVDALESYLGNEKKDTLAKPLPVDFWSYLTSKVRKKGENIQITNISVSTHVSSVIQTLAEIRTKFLDLMLALEQDFPDLGDMTEISAEQKEQINNQITVIMKQIKIENSGDGSTINTGDANQINSASGTNINQNILAPEQKNEVEELMSKIRAVLDENEFNEKEDTMLEVQRVENQLKKDSPNKSIIGQSLETIQSFLTSVAANAWTPPILQGIQNVLGSIG